MKNKTKKITLMGILLALTIVLIMLERLLPPLPFFPPNYKLGISNIIIMFTIFTLGAKEAFTLGILKSFFNMLIRGPMSGIMSLSGGLISIAFIVLIDKILSDRASIVSKSIIGAVGHNVGQLIMAIFVLGSFYFA
ncbi:MAG: Gx transporter family protein, partial [Defluviitaleaceae bacterium]|nr:Gx transporter family protein [Defluviitaleaceae bacterium]